MFPNMGSVKEAQLFPDTTQWSLLQLSDFWILNLSSNPNPLLGFIIILKNHDSMPCANASSLELFILIFKFHFEFWLTWNSFIIWFLSNFIIYEIRHPINKRYMILKYDLNIKISHIIGILLTGATSRREKKHLCYYYIIV